MEDENVTGMLVRPDWLAPYQRDVSELVVPTHGLYDLADDDHGIVNGH